MKTNVLQAKKMFMMLFAMLVPLLASAKKFVEIFDILYEIDDNDKTARVYGVESKEDATSFVIPAFATYEGKTYEVISIGRSAFKNCTNLTEITIPTSVTSIGDGAFNNCRSLQHITIPTSVKWIQDNAFSGCSSLATVHIPYNALLKSIGDAAFSGCSSLATITIPEGVTSIGDKAFYDCYSLTDVYCHAETVPKTETNVFHGNISGATLYVPAIAIEAYKATFPWSRFGNIVALTNEEMGVEQLTMDNPQLTIYDLSGHRVATPTKEGIYVINGKKVMVKIGM